MRASPFRLSSLLAAALAAGLLVVPYAASADVAPAPKKKGCAIEPGPSEGREGAAAFGLCAVAVAGAVVARRARRKA